MRGITFSRVLELASSAAIEVESWPEGTIRLGFGPRCRPVDVSTDWFTIQSGRMYLVGRERIAPLRGVRDRAARRKYPLLTRHRAVMIQSGAELVGVLESLKHVGWCVDNDAYIFPETGDWLAYVGHHDELRVYTRPKKDPNHTPQP